jgi:RsiW-degrading membrane proteinase PrsW (M82 family)
VIHQAAYRRRWRPDRYWLAAALGGVVLLALVASSAATIAVGRNVPRSANLAALPSIGFIVVATAFGLRALHDREPAIRGRDLTRAAVLLAIGVFFWVGIVDVFTFTQDAGPTVATICTLICLPTTAVGLFIVRRLDRNEKEPWRLVLVAVAWGAVVSTSLVIWAEGLWDAVFTANLIPGPAVDASNAYSAGIFEELAKGTAVLLLYLLMRDEFDDVVDGIVYGAAVGLGFNFMESITYMTHLYALLAPQGEGATAVMAQWYARQGLGLFFGHATYTALIGAGIGVARQMPRLYQRVLSVVAGFAIAIAAHFAWDAWVQFYPISNSPFALVEMHLRTLFMEGPFTAVVLLLLAMGLQLEGSALTRQLEAEAATGLGAVRPDEVPILTSPWQRLRVRMAAVASSGPLAYFRVGRLQTAQLHLAMERWHRERHELDEPLAAEEALRQHVLALRPAAAPR